MKKRKREGVFEQQR